MPQNRVPTVTESTGRGERSMDIYSRLLSERIIFVGMPIDSAVGNLITAQLLYLEHSDPDKDINMYINSPGGEGSAMFAIYDAMQYIRPDVATMCVGLAASAAAILLAGGTRGKRAALPHSRILIHQPHVPGGIGGQAVDIAIAAKEILRARRSVDEILSQHTGKSVEQISKDTDRDYFMSAEEAKEYGLVDTVLPIKSGLKGFLPDEVSGSDPESATRR